MKSVPNGFYESIVTFDKTNPNRHKNLILLAVAVFK